MTTSEITMKFSDNGNDKITLVGYNGTPITPPVEMVTKDSSNQFVAADEKTINATVNIISPPANVATSVAVNSGAVNRGATLGGATRRTVRRRTVRRRPMKKGGKKYQSKSIRRK
jgi:hypothetical protein